MFIEIPSINSRFKTKGDGAEQTTFNNSFKMDKNKIEYAL